MDFADLDRLSLQLAPLGIAHSPYGEKFGIPRQGNLAMTVETVLHFDPRRVDPQALQGLADCSHVWVLFWFNELVAPAKAGTVRPPRLGGNQTRGVFATRSPFRPNPIGLSALEVIEVGELTLRLKGGDLANGTPILDVKPYIPYADCLNQAQCAWAGLIPDTLETRIHPDLLAKSMQDPLLHAALLLACDILRWDARPAYHLADDDRVYGSLIGGYNLRFRVQDKRLEIVEAALAQE